MFGIKTSVKKAQKFSPSLVEQANNIWCDPRDGGDRRINHRPEGVPEGGCRRKTDRRKSRYLFGERWWLLRNIVSD